MLNSCFSWESIWYSNFSVIIYLLSHSILFIKNLNTFHSDGFMGAFLLLHSVLSPNMHVCILTLLASLCSSFHIQMEISLLGLRKVQSIYTCTFLGNFPFPYILVRITECLSWRKWYAWSFLFFYVQLSCCFHISEAWDYEGILV